MNHENHQREDDIIDLGAASEETRGNTGGHGDFAGLQQGLGLSED